MTVTSASSSLICLLGLAGVGRTLGFAADLVEITEMDLLAVVPPLEAKAGGCTPDDKVREEKWGWGGGVTHNAQAVHANATHRSHWLKKKNAQTCILRVSLYPRTQSFDYFLIVEQWLATYHPPSTHPPTPTP